MTRKIAALLGTLALLATGLIGLTTTTAQAATPYARTACETWGQVRTCVQVTWARQADGSGVRLEGFSVSTDGCYALEDTNPWVEVRPFWVNPKNEKIDYSYDFGAEKCLFQKDLSNAGRDKGSMDFRYVAKARYDNKKDRKFYIGFTVKPGGGSTVNYSFTTEP